jgi:hypothetical protein
VAHPAIPPPHSVHAGVVIPKVSTRDPQSRQAEFPERNSWFSKIEI